MKYKNLKYSNVLNFLNMELYKFLLYVYFMAHIIYLQENVINFTENEIRYNFYTETEFMKYLTIMNLFH